MKRKHYMIISIFLICLVIGILIYLFLNVKETDGQKFKEEYDYLEIDHNNPFIYKTASEIVDLINNKETFLVYFGYASDENVKKVLPIMIKALNDEKVNKIYYVNLENIRNVMEVNGSAPQTTKMGTMGYYELLKILDEFLPNYELKNLKGKTIIAGKRIEAPTLLSVVEGCPVKLTSGTKDAYNEFITVIKSSLVNACDSSC